jgi:hypothetical protein
MLTNCSKRAYTICSWLVRLSKIAALGFAIAGGMALVA